MTELGSSTLGACLVSSYSHPEHRSTNRPPKPADRKMERVQATINQAKKEAEQFSKSGGQATDANNPNRKWSETLWRYRRKHSGTPATTLATTEADRISQMQAKADTLETN